MAALVAALLIHATDRTAWLAGMLGTRHAPPATLVAGLALGIAATNALAALAGALLAPELSFDARDLLLGVVLLAAGVGAFWPPKRPAETRLGGFLGGLVGTGVLALGDRTLFVTLALAARSVTPALAAIGATIGALAVVVPATLTGEHGRRRLPLAAVRIVLGALLTLAGVIQTLGALRLI